MAEIEGLRNLLKFVNDRIEMFRTGRTRERDKGRVAEAQLIKGEIEALIKSLEDKHG